MTPLHDEHRSLRVHIESLRDAADAVGVVGMAALSDLVVVQLAFLNTGYLPHARAEIEVVYPFVALAMGSPVATASTRREHAEIVGYIHELERLSDRLIAARDVDHALANELRRVLYGLVAVVSLHLAVEEEIYLPLLEDHLTDSQARGMFEGLTTSESVRHRTADID